MAKLAMLLGTTGCGKGWVTDRLASNPQILVIDLIREDAINYLCRDLHPGVIHRWEIWECLLRYFDVVPAIVMGIKNRNGELHDGQPILAEGCLLAHAGFRAKFMEAIESLGCRFSQTKTFFLDPPAQRVYENVMRRGRANQQDYSIEKARESVKWYRQQVLEPSVHRIDDSQQMVDAIDCYLSR